MDKNESLTVPVIFCSVLIYILNNFSSVLFVGRSFVLTINLDNLSHLKTNKQTNKKLNTNKLHLPKWPKSYFQIIHHLETTLFFRLSFFLNLKMMKVNIFHCLTINVSKICMIRVPNYFEYNELLILI